MKTVGILGANGFIGSKIQELMSDNYAITPITRDNYSNKTGEHFDVFINLAGNKRNYWANQNPNKDFDLSTKVVYDSLFDFSCENYVFLSSVAVYDKDSHYGFNKRLSEQIIERHANNYIILRTAVVIDKDVGIGVISDIETGKPLFLTSDSAIQMISRNGLVKAVFELIEKDVQKVNLNFGGLGSVTVDQIQNIMNKKAVFQEGAKYRKYEMDVSELNKIITLKHSADYLREILQ